MYTSYFGFREKPFNVTPDPRFFYPNPVYQEAYATLLCGIRERKGFVVLTGEAGTGKTTLLRRLMDNLGGTVRFVFFYNTNLTFEELLTFTCKELALSVKGRRRLPKIQALNDFLIEQLRRGGTVALLIDEAQNLNEEVLENLRLLSNLETGSEKLLQIVLIGQPELENMLDKPKFRQLKQRIALRYRLDRLKEREVGSYIDYRLRAVGYESNNLFTPDGLEPIAIYSKGVPRLINVICDNALMVTYASSRKKVSGDVIREVACDLRLEPDVRATKVTVRPAVEAEAPKEKGTEAPNGQGTKAPKGKETKANDDEPLKPERRHFTWVAVGSLLVLLFLGAGGAIIYPLQMKNYLSAVDFKFEELIAIAGKSVEFINHNVWLTDLMPREAKLEKIQAPVRSDDSTKSGPEPQSESHSAIDAEPQASKETKPYVSPVILEKEESGQQTSSSTPDIAAPLEKMEPARILHGSAIGVIAYRFYGGKSLLCIDLIKEFNPQLQDLNWASSGFGLQLPPLTREILQRKQPDGSYNLILESFPSLTLAEDFARAVRRRGYEVVITRRKVSEGLSLHRVEITGLKTLEAANQAWKAALANRWVPFTDSLSERKEKRAEPKAP
jgi:type II secretory pathway predicted ATPase ExeA